MSNNGRIAPEAAIAIPAQGMTTSASKAAI
jgi:hypothetical protein